MGMTNRETETGTRRLLFKHFIIIGMVAALLEQAKAMV